MTKQIVFIFLYLGFLPALALAQDTDSKKVAAFRAKMAPNEVAIVAPFGRIGFPSTIIPFLSGILQGPEHSNGTNFRPSNGK